MDQATDFTGPQKSIANNDDRIFAMLSDLSNMDKIKDHIPEDKAKGLTYDSNSFTISINSFGNITFRIVEREPNKVIKFVAENSPIPVTLWIQLKQIAEKDTRMLLTLRTTLNAVVKPMLTKPLQQAVDRLSDLIAKLPYE